MNIIFGKNANSLLCGLKQQMVLNLYILNKQFKDYGY
jgi:hypothetical protein